MPCDEHRGVTKRIDLESVSEDIARLVRQLGDEVEGEVQVDDLRNIAEQTRKDYRGIEFCRGDGR